MLFGTELSDLPSMGVFSDVCGVISDKININTENDNSTVIERESFSPASTGTMKVKAERMASTMVGMMMLSM